MGVIVSSRDFLAPPEDPVHKNLFILLWPAALLKPATSICNDTIFLACFRVDVYLCLFPRK